MYSVFTALESVAAYDRDILLSALSTWRISNSTGLPFSSLKNKNHTNTEQINIW